LQVLANLGIKADVPSGQGCCGALHQHNGFPLDAAKLAQNNLQAFAGSRPIISSASGCGATLMEYPELLGTSSTAFSKRVQDLSSFLLSQWPQDLALKPLQARVAIHTPCTMKNVVKGSDAIRALIEKIPGVEIVALDDKDRCCGAAGSYFITQPAMADQLLEAKLNMARMLAPDIILSSNIGCSLHLAAGLRRTGIKVELLHPVSLLARQLV
jgi:glycolate oxidase iron-sulfur subunit